MIKLLPFCRAKRRPAMILFILFLSLPVVYSHAQTLDSSNLPLVIIDTDSQEILDEPKIVATLRIVDNGSGSRNHPTDKAAFAGKIGIERRGSTSQEFFPKKPYGFELRDSTGLKDISASLLGLPREEDWILNATYNDKTLIRETLTYDLYRSFSKQYTPRYRYCEVLLNGRYEGIYILMEKIKRDKNRVNISKLDPENNTGDDLTGGYILKIDKATGNSAASWLSPYPSTENPDFKIPIQVEYPKEEDLSATQLEYIKKYVTDFENSLKGASFLDSLQGYRRYIDVDSWVDYLIINEVSRNLDAYRLSTFFYKDKNSKGGKLTMGPIWDYNITYGNADYCNGERHQGWGFNFNQVCPKDVFQMPFWWQRMLEDPDFVRRVRLRYQTLRQNALLTDRIHQSIDSTARALQESRSRNFTRWPVIGQKLWPNFFVGATYDDEIAYLKTFVSRRLDWMDQEILTLGPRITAVEPIDTTLFLTVFPNPAPDGRFRVRFSLDQAAEAGLCLYDPAGRLLRQTTLGRLSPGTHEFSQELPTYALHPVVFVSLQIDGKKAASRRLIRE